MPQGAMDAAAEAGNGNERGYEDREQNETQGASARRQLRYWHVLFLSKRADSCACPLVLVLLGPLPPILAANGSSALLVTEALGLPYQGRYPIPAVILKLRGPEAG